MTSNDELLEEFKSIVKPLYEKDNFLNNISYVPGILSHSPGIKKHTVYNPEPEWWCVRFTKMSHDYCLLPTDSLLPHLYKDISQKEVKTIKKDGSIINKKYMEYYYHFDDEKAALNFINYCKTDFCRIFLYIYMTQTLNFMDTTLQYLPWFNFNDPVFSKDPFEIDNYLFEKYKISDKIRIHIENLLFDYY